MKARACAAWATRKEEKGGRKVRVMERRRTKTSFEYSRFISDPLLGRRRAAQKVIYFSSSRDYSSEAPLPNIHLYETYGSRLSAINGRLFGFSPMFFFLLPFPHLPPWSNFSPRSNSPPANLELFPFIIRDFLQFSAIYFCVRFRASNFFCLPELPNFLRLSDNVIYSLDRPR